MNARPAIDREARAPARSWLAQGLAFRTELGPHLYLANGSRVYGTTDAFSRAYDALVAAGDSPGLDRLLAAHGLDAPAWIDDEPIAPFPPRAISLA